MFKFFRDEETGKGFLPIYAIVPLLTYFFFNMFTYEGTKLITDGMVHHTMYSALDGMIPLLPVFSIPYVLSFPQWAICFVMICRESKEHCYRVMFGEVFAKFMALIVFLAYPTIMERPTIEVTEFFSWLNTVIYAWDTPTNLFPSIHCLESTICCLGFLRMKSIRPAWKWVNAVFTLFVYASTVFVKQHVAWDILGGVGFAVIGLGVTNLVAFCIKRKRDDRL